jgi:hypothetical protein
MAEPFFEQIRIAIESRFKTFWDLNGGGMPVKWPDVPFTQPSGGSWIAFHILNAKGVQGSIGSVQLEVQRGEVNVQIFVPPNTGTKQAMDTADLISEAFRWRQLTAGAVNVTMRSPSLLKAPERQDFVQWNLVIEFDARKVITRP